jgi:heme/copper-type cytochrome/quinol oxidase subunit 2
MKKPIMFLAALCVASLVTVTWALVRLSVWIVAHDSVWAEMDAKGASLEHQIAEWFLVAGLVYIPAVEFVIGGVFLFLLWRALSKPKETSR